ncbi:MAG: T9SS type A sorting domain-containing protein [Chitinispirillaceae bacterium]|nr:T9SS type A sorting domain-containing protein [Chitinispirillaceae bacterium]
MDGGYLLTGQKDNGTVSYIIKMTSFTQGTYRKTRHKGAQAFSIRVYPGHAVCHISANIQGPVTLAVHDMAGRTIAQRNASFAFGQDRAISWGYSGSHNSRVAPGVYSLSITHDTYSFSKSLVVQP